MEYFRSLISTFRRMDDLEGGSTENLRHVSNAISQVTYYIGAQSFTNSAGARDLVGVLAQMTQIAGWMAHDAERHGLAQRYFRTALQASHSVGDRDLGAYVLACMIYQAVDRGQLKEAEELAGAALKAAKSAHPLVQSMILARVVHLRAASGDDYGFRRASDQVSELFEQRQITDGGPNYLYWFDATRANTHKGQDLLLLILKDPRATPAQLDEATRLLAVERFDDTSTYPRDALFFSAWLARAHVKRGDLRQGLTLVENALSRTGAVCSPRACQVLRKLDADLAARRSVDDLKDVKELRRELRPLIAV
jgi:hypothetical protein